MCVQAATNIQPGSLNTQQSCGSRSWSTHDFHSVYIKVWITVGSKWLTCQKSKVQTQKQVVLLSLHFLQQIKCWKYAPNHMQKQRMQWVCLQLGYKHVSQNRMRSGLVISRSQAGNEGRPLCIRRPCYSLKTKATQLYTLRLSPSCNSSGAAGLDQRGTFCCFLGKCNTLAGND